MWSPLSLNAYIKTYLEETANIAAALDQAAIAQALTVLERIREQGGRLFILGVGGSAANASHAVNDFRKIAGLESYTPLDNVSELTAWINDVGWEAVFTRWLRTSRLCQKDAILILSVGGGTETTSTNLVRAMEYARDVGAAQIAVVSRDGGWAKQLCNVTILIPVLSPERTTPHAEGFQAMIWHLLVNALAQG